MITMPVKIHRPEKANPTLNIPSDAPLLFFAGPAEGVQSWQESAVFRTSVIADHIIPTTVHIAEPSCVSIPKSNRLTPTDQRTWERQHYTHAALKGGVVAFWLAAELTSKDTAPSYAKYDQSTQAGFSEVVGMCLAKPDVQVVLGIDQAHSGRGLKEYRHAAAELGISIHNSLGSLCISALELMPSYAR